MDLKALKALEVKLLAHPDLSGLSAKEQFAMIKERSVHIVGEERLLDILNNCVREKRPLRVKYGIDATGREIHLGHAVSLFVLRRLQKMGHHIILLIGDFTAQVGDPSGHVSTRPMLSSDEIKRNAANFTEQAGRILDISRTEVRFNSEWLESFSLTRFFQILSGLTVSTAMARKDFRERETITRAELLYSTLMAIDSVELKAELELGGDDQLLNFYDTEQVMKNDGMFPQTAVTTDILLGTSGDGAKMSKSLGNYISVVELPSEMFGKLMSIPDHQLEQFFKLLTDISDNDWNELQGSMKDGSVNPMDVKRLLARTVVADLNNMPDALAAEEEFNQKVVKKEVPKDLAVVQITKAQAQNWPAILRALNLSKVSSNAAACRLLDGNGVHRQTVSGENTVGIDDPVPQVGEEIALRIGKHVYAKFVIIP